MISLKIMFSLLLGVNKKVQDIQAFRDGDCVSKLFQRKRNIKLMNLQGRLRPILVKLFKMIHKMNVPSLKSFQKGKKKG